MKKLHHSNNIVDAVVGNKKKSVEDQKKALAAALSHPSVYPIAQGIGVDVKKGPLALTVLNNIGKSFAHMDSKWVQGKGRKNDVSRTYVNAISAAILSTPPRLRGSEDGMNSESSSEVDAPLTQPNTNSNDELIRQINKHIPEISTTALIHGQKRRLQMSSGDLSSFDVRPDDAKRRKIDSPTLIEMQKWIDKHPETSDVPYGSKDKTHISDRDHHRKCS